MIDFNTFQNTTANKRVPIKTIQKPKGELLLETNLLDDIVYAAKDTKKDVFNLVNALKSGKSNDHDLGSMGNLGLLAGGAGIASYLATKKATPLTKLMEFVGVGTFIGSMALWPKIFIDTPTKAFFGFDPHRKYIDSQGRKKDFFTDNQYLPWDLWSSEEINQIGDKMFVPKNIPERENYIKEKMRTIALQDNTLWMLSAGFGVPLMTALVSSAVKEPLGDVIRNAKFDFYKNWADNIENYHKYFDVRKNISAPFFTKFSQTEITTSRTKFIDDLIRVFSPIEELAHNKDLGDREAFENKAALNRFGLKKPLTKLMEPKFIEDFAIEDLAEKFLKNPISFKLVNDELANVRNPIVKHHPRVLKFLPPEDIAVRKKDFSFIADTIEAKCTKEDFIKLLKKANEDKSIDKNFAQKIVQAGIDLNEPKYLIPDSLIKQVFDTINETSEYTRKSDKMCLKNVAKIYDTYMRQLISSTNSLIDMANTLYARNEDSFHTKAYLQIRDTFAKALRLTDEEMLVILKGSTSAENIVKASDEAKKVAAKYADVIAAGTDKEAIKVANEAIGRAQKAVDDARNAVTKSDDVIKNAFVRLVNNEELYNETAFKAMDICQKTNAKLESVAESFIKEHLLLLEKQADGLPDEFNVLKKFYKNYPMGTRSGTFKQQIVLLKACSDADLISAVTRFLSIADYEIQCLQKPNSTKFLRDFKAIPKMAPVNNEEAFKDTVKHIIYHGDISAAANQNGMKNVRQMYEEVMDFIYNPPTTSRTQKALRYPEYVIAFNEARLEKKVISMSKRNFATPNFKWKRLYIPQGVEATKMGNRIETMLADYCDNFRPSNRWTKMFAGMFVGVCALTVGAQMFFGRTDGRKREVLNTHVNV